jgi:hypothetical protein
MPVAPMTSARLGSMLLVIAIIFRVVDNALDSCHGKDRSGLILANSVAGAMKYIMTVRSTAAVASRKG